MHLVETPSSKNLFLPFDPGLFLIWVDPCCFCCIVCIDGIGCIGCTRGPATEPSAKRPEPRPPPGGEALVRPGLECRHASAQAHRRSQMLREQTVQGGSCGRMREVMRVNYLLMQKKIWLINYRNCKKLGRINS